jgi:hypothetical protein
VRTVLSQKLAQELRIRLWQEHLQDYASTADMRDFNQASRAWERLAGENGRRVSRNDGIKGHAYYYNFEEMGLLPPCPDVRGSTEFELL